jgi:hypothetical protein
LSDPTHTAPLTLVLRVAEILDSLGVPYALGGSLASSLFGEPRATADVDVAILVEPAVTDDLLDAMTAEFYVPIDAARAALGANGSFNVIAVEQGVKVDLFVLGETPLDRRQIEPRKLGLADLLLAAMAEAGVE